jgi:hypothetical protein
MRKLLLKLGLFFSLTLFGLSKTHSFLFIFDTKAVAVGKSANFSSFQYSNTTLTLFDGISCFLLNDPVAGDVFDIKNVEKDYKRNILVFTSVKRKLKILVQYC